MQRAQPFARALALSEVIRSFTSTMTGLDLQRTLAALPACQSRGKGCGARHAQACKTPNHSSVKYARTFNGAREVARRQRQIQANKLKAQQRAARMMDTFDMGIS